MFTSIFFLYFFYLLTFLFILFYCMAVFEGIMFGLKRVPYLIGFGMAWEWKMRKKSCKNNERMTRQKVRGITMKIRIQNAKIEERSGRRKNRRQKEKITRNKNNKIEGK